MRRFLSPSLALLGVLALTLTGCSGDTPTSPSTDGGGTPPSCAVTINLAATSVTPLAGSAVIVRASVMRSGSPVPDGTSVVFTTDLGFFLETGLPTVSKVISGGVADVTLGSVDVGTAHVKATYDCKTQPIDIEFDAPPANGPFISSVNPASGSCAGAESVTINGGRFGTDTGTTRVTFGGAPASIQTQEDGRLVVRTPSRTLANPQVPETVDVVVTVNAGTAGAVATPPKSFTYYCVDKRISISSVVPAFGKPEGAEEVVVNGVNFGTSVATTRVTFGGVAATITAQQDSAITVLTPRHLLANPQVSETVDVGVTIDLGLVSQQSALLPQSFTYTAGGTIPCGTRPDLFISSVSPTSGSAAGGTPVTISGGGFGTSVSALRVEFGGQAAQVLSASNTSISVSTPRYTLANPDVPETVDVVVYANVGQPTQACAQAADAYTYAPGVTDPVIYSISPVTGPNDASTRVTIFGAGFQFPMQVFVGEGDCRREAPVVSVSADQIVFLTPIASGGNVCLAGELVSIEVVNPATGKRATSPDSFKYYACPTASVATPSYGPYNQKTTVTINGNNFEEPVEAWFEADEVNFRLTVVSVSSNFIVVELPPIDPRQLGGGDGTCANVSGNIRLAFPSLACPTNPSWTLLYTYRIPELQIATVSPATLPQTGGASTVTVTGANFEDPMTVEILKNGAVQATINNAAVANSGALSFTAPAMPDSAFNQNPCIPPGGTTVTGVQYVPTSFDVRVTNQRTSCSATLRNAIVYNPIDTTCRAPILVTGAPNPTATLCTAYAGGTFTASGGTAPYNFSVTGLPNGVSFAPAATSVTISGTPALAAAGSGAASTPYSVTISVTDASAPTQTGSTSFTVVLNDPGAPFAVSGPGVQTVTAGAAAVPANALTAGPNGFPAIAWTATASPTPAAGAIQLSAASGTTSTLTAAAGTTPGAYTVTVTATDSACGAFQHQASRSVNLTVN